MSFKSLLEPSFSQNLALLTPGTSVPSTPGAGSLTTPAVSGVNSSFLNPTLKPQQTSDGTITPNDVTSLPSYGIPSSPKAAISGPTIPSVASGPFQVAVPGVNAPYAPGQAPTAGSSNSSLLHWTGNPPQSPQDVLAMIRAAEQVRGPMSNPDPNYWWQVIQTNQGRPLDTIYQQMARMPRRRGRTRRRLATPITAGAAAASQTSAVCSG
jgi:hypothetical protein